MERRLVLLAVLLLALAPPASAYQPWIALNANSSMEDPIVIWDPEMSQTFYGQLSGNPDYYEFTVDKPLTLYVGLLLPDVAGRPKSKVSAEIYDSSGKRVRLVDGNSVDWTPYFEKREGHWYLKGPEARVKLAAGSYSLKVSTADNNGIYSLEVGNVEYFRPIETPRVYLTLILLKRFFNKPIILPFINLAGILIVVGTLMVFDVLVFISGKSKESIPTALAVYRLTMPLMLTGITVTAVTWLALFIQNTSNMLGFLNTMILLVLLLVNAYCNHSLERLGLKGEPLPQHMMLCLLVLFVGWWLFLFLSVIIY